MSLNLVIQLLGLIGVLLSAYSLFVERKLADDPKYKPSCDLGTSMKCSTAFKSKYGHLLGFSNAWGGLALYGAIVFAVKFGWMELVLLLAHIAIIGSLYLAYISYKVLKNACPICVVIYLTSFGILILSWLAL